MSKLENSGDVGWAIFPISFNFCSSPDTRQRPCGQETGVTISGTLVIADTALCKVSSTFLQLVDAAPAQFVWCDVGAGCCWLPPGLLLSVFIQWVLTLTRILNILPWPSHNISHNMPPPPHTAMLRLTCSAREKISIRNSKTISGGIKSSKHSRKKFNKARMLSA